MVVNFLLMVVLRADNPSGHVVEISHHTSLHVHGWDAGTPSGDTGRVHGLPVDRNVQAAILSPPE